MEHTIVPDLITRLAAYFQLYNSERLHQSLLAQHTAASDYRCSALVEKPRQ